MWVYIVEECRGSNLVNIAGRVRVDRSIAPEEVEVSWNHGYANKSLRVRFRHTAENPLGNWILEQNSVDQIACVPASDTPNFRQYDELAIIFSSGHLDGEEQSQNARDPSSRSSIAGFDNTVGLRLVWKSQPHIRACKHV